MKVINLIWIIPTVMLLTIGLFGGGVYFGKRMDQICLGTENNNFQEPIAEMAEKKK